MALTINGKKRNLHRNDFLKYAELISLPEKAAIRLIEKVKSMKDQYYNLCYHSFLPSELQDRFVKLMEERILSLEKK